MVCKLGGKSSRPYVGATMECLAMDLRSKAGFLAGAGACLLASSPQRCDCFSMKAFLVVPSSRDTNHDLFKNV